MGVATIWVHLHGGADNTDPYAAQLVAWMDGAYVGWPEIRAHYLLNRDEIVAGLSGLHEQEDEIIDWTDEIQ